jgi:flagellar basal body-associated protein FliL
MKLIVILVVLVGVLGGGGFAAWTFYRAPLEEAVKEMMKPKEPPSMQHPLDPLTLPLFKNNQPDRFLTLEMVLVVAGQQGVNRVKSLQPRLIDAYIQYLHSLAALNIKPGFDDLDFVRDRLVIVSNEVAGPKVVRDILFKNAFEKPLQ